MEVNSTLIGEKLIEGKTKQVFQLKNDPNLVYVLSKDQITAGDGLKKHRMEGKAVLSTKTNCALFSFLNACHVPTHFVSRVSSTCSDWERSFVAKKCEMVPIEWVARRVATGSFLKRHPHVKEGTRFAPPYLETFFKDDANHDPYWSRETLEGAKLKVGNITIERRHVTLMFELTRLVFELIERVWLSANHSLIDMKIEFGVIDDTLVVADVIDNDSWRLWPEGKKELMLDKQVYRNLDVKAIDEKAIQSLRTNFETVAKRTEDLFSGLVAPSLDPLEPEVVVLCGSGSDKEFCLKIKDSLRNYGINDVKIVVTSAHKTTAQTLQVVNDVIQSPKVKAIIAVAGLSNGLGPVVSGNCSLPVINCPPIKDTSAFSLDVWSSLRMPSGIGVTTCLGAENAALGAALIVGVASRPFVWCRIRTNQCLNALKTLFID